MAVWDSTKAVIDIQVGGPGNPWQVFGIEGSTTQVMATGASGGGQPIADRFGRDVVSGQIRRVSRVRDGNPEPATFDVSKRLSDADFNRISEFLRIAKCEVSWRKRQGCANFTDRTGFSMALLYDMAYTVGRSFSANTVDATTDQSQDVMRVFNVDAGEELMLKPVSHQAISGSVSDFALNKIAHIGYFQCGGVCGVAQNDGDWYIAVSDSDSTPGYLGTARPRYYMTDNGGTAWNYAGYIDIAGNAPALDVVRVGALILVAVNGAGGGIAYARFQDLVDGGTSPSPSWSFASGVNNAAGSARALAVADGATVYAAGDGGYIHRSTDGGFSFSVLSAGTVTTQQLNAVAFADSTLGYFGGNSRTLIRFQNGVLSALTLPAALTGNITTVAIPDPARRGYEVYVGTSTGQIWRNRQAGRISAWEQLSFPNSGSGSIADIEFANPGGQVMYVVQTNAASQSRILRDLSGGAMGSDVEVLGAFTSPSNAIINSVAPATINDALSVGELVGGVAFIGKIA